MSCHIPMVRQLPCLPYRRRANHALKVIGTDADRSTICDLLLTFHSNHGSILYRCRDKPYGDFNRKSHVFHPRVFSAPEGVPKKAICQNAAIRRGITLLSVPGKIFASVVLDRIKKAVDNAKRQEQADFRPGRSCND